MFEYFVFSFALAPTFVVESSEVGQVRSPSYAPSTRTTSQSSSPSYLDKLYHGEVLQSYLNFFLPPKPFSMMQSSAVSSNMLQTPTRPSYSSRNSMVSSSLKTTPSILPQKLDNSSIFKCAAVEALATASSTAQFAIEALIEVWLCQNDYFGAALMEQLEGGPGVYPSITSKQGYLKPNSYQLACISQLINHLVLLDLKTISNEQVSRVICDRQGGQMDIIYDINKAYGIETEY
jgi:hypothetical protein